MTTATTVQAVTPDAAYAAKLHRDVALILIPPHAPAAVRVFLRGDRERAIDAIGEYEALIDGTLHWECMYQELAGYPDPHAAALAKAAAEATHAVALLVNVVARATQIAGAR